MYTYPIRIDEDNWRNDYPDEEQLFGSDSDEEGAHSRMAYRYRDGYGKFSRMM